MRWVDAAKGFGIILVVLGHELRGLMHAGIVRDDGPMQLVDRWIYSFHMPLFFYLAGLFVPKALDSWSEVGTFLQKKLATIVYPYFVWSILTIVLKSFLGSIPNTPRDLSDIPHILYAPVEQYWFLYALFLIFVFFALARKWGLPVIAIAGLSALAWVVPPSSPWAIFNVAASHSLYFLCGALFAERMADRHDGLRWPLALVLALGLSLATFAYDWQPVSALAGICFALSLVHLVPRGFGNLLAFLGRYALEIYLTHSIVSAAVRVLLVRAGIHAPLVHLAAGLALGICVPLAIAHVARKRAPFIFTLKERG